VLRTRFEARGRGDTSFLGLTGFEADKLMRLFYKLWDVRPELKGRSGRLIAHLPADPDFNDKHGHRVAFARIVRPADSASNYTPVLSQFRSFDSSGPDAARMMDELRDRDGFPVYVPLTTPTDLTRLVRNGYLDEVDVAFVQAFGRSTERLSIDQIVAVGRHERPDATEQSLIWELRRWHEWMDAALLNADLLEVGDPLSSLDETALCAWQAWSFGLECIKKAGVDAYGFVSDQTYYRDGMLRLSEQSERAINSLLVVQMSRDAIWKDARIASKRLAAFAAWALSTYFAGSLRSMSAFSASRLANVFKSLQGDDIESARLCVMKLYQYELSDTPAVFEVSSLATKPAAGVALPSMAEITTTAIGRLSATVRAATSRIYENLIAPHVPEVSK
jgi:hypothetical protein